MKVLITPQFNKSMQSLSKDLQKEVIAIFSLASDMDQTQLTSSPLLTKLVGGEESIYTLRGRSVRVFCTFDASENILFLDVGEISEPTFERTKPKNSETTLFGRKGEPIAYIATDEENTIYSFNGEPLAYLDQSNIYRFNGQHIGWFEDGIIWNHQGHRVGFIREKSPVFTSFEPFKGFKRFKPFKGFKQFAPLKPLKSLIMSNVDLLSFLRGVAN
jgi:mRNA-degrading endonuclease RelE of RelBE toxin-antitoxin system